MVTLIDWMSAADWHHGNEASNGPDFSIESLMSVTKILFVDDDPGVLRSLETVLVRSGFEVSAVASVPEALELISSKHFDVLLSDLNIGQPGDGFTVVSAMRRVQPHACTFILTGYPDIESAIQALPNYTVENPLLDLNSGLGRKLVYGSDGDLIAELPKGSRQHLGTFLLFPGTHSAALLDKSHSFMQDLPNYTTEPMGNGPDGGLIA